MNRKRKYLWAVRLFFVAIILTGLYSFWYSQQSMQVSKTRTGINVNGSNCFEKDLSKVCYTTLETHFFDSGIPITWAVQNPDPTKGKWYYYQQINRYQRNG